MTRLAQAPALRLPVQPPPQFDGRAFLTGNLDVRPAARQLPEEPGTMLPDHSGGGDIEQATDSFSSGD